MKLTQDKGKISLQLDAPIKDKRQLYILKKLIQTNPTEAIGYINSFNGKAGRRGAEAAYLRNQMNDNIDDKLAMKQKDFYLKQFETMFNTDTNHRPSNLDLGQWIGVEIECMVPYNSVSGHYQCSCFCDEHETDLEHCGCRDCENDCTASRDSDSNAQKALGKLIEEKKIKRVSVKYDGSIQAARGFFGVELTIVFHKNDRSSLSNLCKVLNDLGATVNKSCGLHVHLDQRDIVSKAGYVNTRELNRRARNLGKCLGLFSTIVPRSRLNNTYCALSVSRLAGSRYHAVNLTAFRKYQTIEVRLHSSTTDFKKISNWIDILLLVSRTEKLTARVTTLSDFCMAVNVPEKLIAYIESRQAKFAGLENQTEEVDLTPIEHVAEATQAA